MSTRRLNASELATYLIGEAVMRQLRHAPRDPDTRREIDAVGRWVFHWLTREEYGHVVCNTFYILDPAEAEDWMPQETPRARTKPPLDDDIPF